MLLIACPWCGPRDETEFTCGGQSHIARPEGEVAAAAWADYLFTRVNPRGIHKERWVHAFGCRQWFNVARDTLTHQVTAVYRMDETCPGGVAP